MASIGQMIKHFQESTVQKCNGGFSAETHCGHNITKFKSALQKYVRRGNGKLLEVSKEIIATRLACNSDEKLTGGEKAMVSNLCNRLRICAIEDVSQTCIDDVNFILQSINKWQKDSISNWNSLYKACVILRRVKKSRVNSHLKYISHPYAEDKNILLQKKEFKENEINRKRLHNAYILCNTYNEYLGTNLHDSSLKVKKTAGRKKKAFFRNFWMKLEKICIEYDVPYLKENISLKKEIFEGRVWFKEEFIVLLSALESVRAHFSKRSTPSIVEKYSEEMKLETDWYEKHEKLIIDEDYVNDLHVTKSNDKSMEFFVYESAKVMNEDEDWSLSSLQEQYNRIKIRCDKEDRKKKRGKKRPSSVDDKKEKKNGVDENKKRKYRYEYDGDVNGSSFVKQLKEKKKT